MSDLLPVEELIRRIHAAPGQLVLAITGGGSQAIGELLSVPGGSQTVLEAVVPYSAISLEAFLHARPEHFCSARTARMMAMAAFERARRFRNWHFQFRVRSPRFHRGTKCRSRRPSAWVVPQVWPAIAQSAVRTEFMSRCKPLR